MPFPKGESGVATPNGPDPAHANAGANAIGIAAATEISATRLTGNLP